MTPDGMVAPFPAWAYGLICLIVMSMGAAIGIIVYRALRDPASLDVYFDKVCSERSKLKRDIAAVKAEREDMEACLEMEQEHSFRLITDREYYWRHASLDQRVERATETELQHVDARV